MFKSKTIFSSSSVNDLAKAEVFYGETLGFEIHERGEMGFGLRFANGGQHFIYPKKDHQPASFTVLNLVVDNIADAMHALKDKGVQFEQYDLGGGAKTDEQGVLRGLSVGMGPDIAWFKDPAGNVLSVLQEK
jgi:catechol 2,3-dioxygenase-like lactoylglutathione lyase family enzyme